MARWLISPEKFLSADEIRALRKTLADAAALARAKGNQAPVRDRLVIDLGLGTGLRVSEMANLQVDDLFLKKGQNSLHVRNGKGNKDRLVQFSSSLKSCIIDYINYRRSDSPYLLASERGNQLTPSGIQQLFKKWAKRADLPKRYSIHSLRHTYATRLYKASGYNLRLVQKQLGHSSVSTTQVYADVQSEDIDEALSNLDPDQAE